MTIQKPIVADTNKPKGKIAQVWRKVKVAGHAEAVLAAAKSL